MFDNPIAQKTLWLLGLASGATALGIGTWALTRGGSAQAAAPSYTPPPASSGSGSTDNTPAGTYTGDQGMTTTNPLASQQSANANLAGG